MILVTKSKKSLEKKVVYQVRYFCAGTKKRNHFVRIISDHSVETWYFFIELSFSSCTKISVGTLKTIFIC